MQPHYLCKLKPEFWRDRNDEYWENHFVTVAKVVKNKVTWAHIPILTAEYRSNPTVWPKGAIVMDIILRTHL